MRKIGISGCQGKIREKPESLAFDEKTKIKHFERLFNLKRIITEEQLLQINRNDQGNGAPGQLN